MRGSCRRPAGWGRCRQRGCVFAPPAEPASAEAPLSWAGRAQRVMLRHGACCRHPCQMRGLPRQKLPGLCGKARWFPWEAGCSRQARPSMSTRAVCGRSHSEPLVDAESVLWTLGAAQGRAAVMLVWSHHPGHIAAPSLRPLVLQVREGPGRAGAGLACSWRGAGSPGPWCPSPPCTSGLPCQSRGRAGGPGRLASSRALCRGPKSQEDQSSGRRVQRGELRRPVGAPLSSPAHTPPGPPICPSVWGPGFF